MRSPNPDLKIHFSPGHMKAACGQHRAWVQNLVGRDKRHLITCRRVKCQEAKLGRFTAAY